MNRSISRGLQSSFSPDSITVDIRWSLSTLSALLRMNIFTHIHLWTWIDNPFHVDPEIENPDEQMELNFS